MVLFKRSVAISMIPFLFVSLILSQVPVVQVFGASTPPRNGEEAWQSGFKGIVDPRSPVVLQLLHDLCPTIDEEHFTSNFLLVYSYCLLFPYAYDSDVYGVRDFWQTSEETILIGHGDCEDQAINLATMIEALYGETYGYIPLNLVWVVVGTVKTSGAEAGHGWVLVNEGLLPRETIEEIKTVSISDLIHDVIFGGVAMFLDLSYEILTKLDCGALDNKGSGTFSLLYSGERYFELEPTWNLPISEFYFKKYPYTRVWVIFNSQYYNNYPSFYQVEQPPYLGAEIKNIAFPPRVIIGDYFTMNITVQNYDLGVLGADLVVIIKNYGVEIGRASAYVFKYWWQVKTFRFQGQAVEPAQIEQLSVELYWNNYGEMLLRDFKNFTIQTIPNYPDLVLSSFTILPQHPYEGQLVTFFAIGQNDGPVPSGAWLLNISINGQLFDSISVDSCEGFTGFIVSSKPWVAVAGAPTIDIVADASGSVLEINETNNEIASSLAVSQGLKILSPENKTYTTSDVPLIITIDQPTSWIAYSLDDQANVTLTGNTTLNTLPEGMHSIIVYANDTLGNILVSPTIRFTIALPRYELTVTSSPIANVPFTINGVSKTTPYTDFLLEGSYTLAMPETYHGYIWLHWLEDGDTSRIKTITLPGSTHTAVYTAPEWVGGHSVSVSIEKSSPWITATLLLIFAFLSAGFTVKRSKHHTRQALLEH